MRVNFAAIQDVAQLERDAQPLARAPKSFLELVVFSVTVSVVSQLVMQYLFAPKRR
jgi:hypothetical protein